MAFDSQLFANRADILSKYEMVRAATMRLAAPLSPEDWMLQSMPDASPLKWNLAHTSWFFETFILKPHASGYALFDTTFAYLFNSYYNQVGDMHPRDQRGLISRPTAKDVKAYRAHVDTAMRTLLEGANDNAIEMLAPLVALGLAHEEQHQELLLTDLLHGFAQNPVKPAAYAPDGGMRTQPANSLKFVEQDNGLHEIGWKGEGFAFDNEGPRHKVFLEPYALADRLITNGEFLSFIEEGGYASPALWLSDGWERVQSEKWTAPLYWREEDGQWFTYSLFGEMEIDPHAPVSHLSYYEAAAFAAWAGARLPTEFEWEAAAAGVTVAGNFIDNGAPVAVASAAPKGEGLQQLFGDVWEWTSSAYSAYPGYRPAEGAIGEYNGKFMSGQMVLRGGSCATPKGHIRPTYRNFFPPHARWQFSGVRLAKDV